MQWIAHLALGASIAASVLGALAMAVLVFRHGFTIPAPSDTAAGPTPTDVLITRVGHAVVGMCFAATAVLAVVGLSLRAPERRAPATAAAPPAAGAPVRPSPASGAPRTGEPEASVEALEVRLAVAESRLTRLDGEVRSPSRPTPAPGRTAGVMRREVRRRWPSRGVAHVRAAIRRAGETVVRRLGGDPLGRVSARD